ncbi:hypothetical protein TOPH_06702 [Tolypocladium ophioglossoides CBS 100239]|uniref:Nucleoside 2-deoxyribosyltransferase n=1 Tax=Tolypocladium ophioglossoides (strain CBS 100239) TaxID=1163406 RepID=A0A0L0N3B3_TOLOC|nr:hypothetical protein TOPH_06702 [Tolypocladium ophioglossoides CBS 100239]
MATPTRATVVQAPSRPSDDISLKPSIFLGGTTSATLSGDWRRRLIASLAARPVALLNPQRADWDATWREDFSDPRWAEQVAWELDMQERADVLVFLLHPVSDAPVSLLELGLCVNDPGRKVVVCALDGFPRRGNVEAVCRRYGRELVGTEAELTDSVRAALEACTAKDWS